LIGSVARRLEPFTYCESVKAPVTGQRDCVSLAGGDRENH
jgi:hypothetical protein